MLTQESLFLTRVLGKKSWPKKGSGRRGILWKIHGNPWRIRENPWNINGKSAEIYGESAGIHWKSLENLWKSIIKQALFGYSLLAMVPTFAACASFARGLTFATGPTGSNPSFSRTSIENPWKTHGNPRKIRGNPLKIMENPGKKLIWQRWPATWSSEPSCMLGYRNNLSMHSQNTPKKSVRNKKLTQESDPNN